MFQNKLRKINIKRWLSYKSKSAELNALCYLNSFFINSAARAGDFIIKICFNIKPDDIGLRRDIWFYVNQQVERKFSKYGCPIINIMLNMIY